MTTFEGAGVWSGPALPLPLPLPFELLNGTPPWSRLRVISPTTSSPTIDRTGANQLPRGPSEIGARGEVRGAAGRVMTPSRRGGSRRLGPRGPPLSVDGFQRWRHGGWRGGATRRHRTSGWSGAPRRRGGPLRGRPRRCRTDRTRSHRGCRPRGGGSVGYARRSRPGPG